MSVQSQLKQKLDELGVQRLSVFPGEVQASPEAVAEAVLGAITNLEAGDFDIVTL